MSAMSHDPTHHAQEEIQHHATHGGGPRWIMGVAVSSAILAALAAVGSLLEGHHGHEAMLDRMKASDQWAFYQAKSIKSAILKTKLELQGSMGKRAAAEDKKKLEEYAKEQEEITKEAKELEDGSATHFAAHLVFARAVTLLQVAIAVGAIAVLAGRIAFWFISLGFGAIGLGFFLLGLLH